MTAGNGNVKFAPAGLANMLNCGGAIAEVECSDIASVRISVKGEGWLLAYSSSRPVEGLLNGVSVGFGCLADEGKLEMDVSWDEERCGNCEVVFVY